MRNLLPKQNKKIIRREYLIRVFGIGLVFLFMASVLGSVFLLPSFFFSRAKEESVRTSAEIVRKSVEFREKNSSDILLEEAKQKLELLSNKNGGILVQDIVIKITDEKPYGVSLYGISYMELTEGRSRVTLTGVAGEREDMLSFRKYLEQDVLFSSVRLPVSNLAKDKDIEFSIEIEIEPQT